MKHKIYGLELVGDLAHRQTPTNVVVRTTDYNTASPGDVILWDTTGGIFTVTLPASPQDKDQIGLIDIGGYASAKNLTIARNGKKIMGYEEDLTVDLNYASFNLRYVAANNDWRVC